MLDDRSLLFRLSFNSSASAGAAAVTAITGESLELRMPVWRLLFKFWKIDIDPFFFFGTLILPPKCWAACRECLLNDIMDLLASPTIMLAEPLCEGVDCCELRALSSLLSPEDEELRLELSLSDEDFSAKSSIWDSLWSSIFTTFFSASFWSVPLRPWLFFKIYVAYFFLAASVNCSISRAALECSSSWNAQISGWEPRSMGFRLAGVEAKIEVELPPTYTGEPVPAFTSIFNGRISEEII